MILVGRIVVALIAIEVLARLIWGSVPSSIIGANYIKITPYSGMAFRPNQLINYRDDWGQLTTDDFGFISTDNPVDTKIVREKLGVQRVVVLGGSTVEGRGASANAETIPSRLSACLNSKASKHYEVINAGFPGDYSYNQFARLLTEVVPRVKPDILIVLDGRNDAHYQMYHKWAPFKSNPGVLGPYEAVNAIANLGSAGVSNWFLMEHTAIGGVARRLMSRVRAAKVDDSEVGIFQTVRGVHEYATTHGMISNWAAANSISFYHFLQPTLFDGAKIYSTEEIIFINTFNERFHDNSIPYFSTIKTFYTDVKFVMDGNPEFFDISNLFANDKTTRYVDSVHYNDSANTRVADIICNTIKRTEI